MKTRGTNANAMNNDSARRRALNIMLLFLGALAFCYILLLGDIIFNIIERRALEADARIISNEVAGLELQYLSASDTIDLALAKSMGFQETKAKFAVRRTLGSIKLAKNEL